MKKIVLLLIMICFILCGCKKQEEPVQDVLSIIKSRDKIIVGVRDDTAPFGFRDNKGNLTGFDVDLAKITAKYLLGSEEKVELVPVTAQNRIMKLNSGEVDILIATMSTTWQRWQLVDFSNPYFIAGQAIMVKKSNPAMGLRALKGKKLSVVYGSTGEENLRKNIPDVEVTGYKNYAEAFQALKAGKVEGIFADDTILYGLANHDNSVKILPARYSEEPYAIAARKENSKELIEKINYIIENLQNTKQLDKLEKKWKVDN